MSLYLYVHGNPFGLVDPMGLMGEPTKHWYNPFTWLVDTSDQVPEGNPVPANARDADWQARRMARAIESNAGHADAERMREIRSVQKDYSESGDLTDINRLEGGSEREIRNSFTGGQFNADAKVRGEEMKGLSEFAVTSTASGFGATAGLGAAPNLSGRLVVTGGGRVGATVVEEVAQAGVRSYRSFRAFKSGEGKAGAGVVWHHIVEQRSANVERFGARAIHNTENVVNVPQPVNQRLADFYNSKQWFSDNMRVRHWLDTKSYEFQRQFGLEYLKKFGEEYRASCKAAP